jgi:hypothetical protein
MPSALPVGQFTLNGAVYPTNAFNTAVLYSVKDAEATGASVSGDVLTTKTPGTVIITVTVRDGLLENGDYTHDFSIVINKAVYVTGQNRIDTSYKACYWIDDGTFSNYNGPAGKFYDLSVPAVTTASYTSGVVFAGDMPYIAGYYTADGNNKVCYWVNGVFKTLPESTGATGNVNDPSTRACSIASDGATVYITGIVGGTYCYWKINADGTASKKTLTSTGTVKANFNGRFAAGGGKVYIPFQDTSNNSFYWDENGTVVPVTELNGVNSITCAAVENGTVYFAGANASGCPYYFAGGSAASAALQNSAGSVNSIVKQNGALRFYGVSGNVPYSWSMTDGSQIFSDPLGNDYVADTGNVAFSDGGVYIMQSASYAAYLNVLRDVNESSTSISGPKNNDNTFTGIAVTQEN